MAHLEETRRALAQGRLPEAEPDLAPALPDVDPQDRLGVLKVDEMFLLGMVGSRGLLRPRNGIINLNVCKPLQIILRGGFPGCTCTTAPADLEVLEVSRDIWTRSWAVLVRSRTLDPVKPGTKAPEMSRYVYGKGEVQVGIATDGRLWRSV